MRGNHPAMAQPTSSSSPSATNKSRCCQRRQQRLLPCELLDELLIYFPRQSCHRISGLLSTSSVVYNLLSRNKSFRRWRQNEIEQADLNFQLANGKSLLIPRVHLLNFPVEIPANGRVSISQSAHFYEKYMTQKNNGELEVSFLLRFKNKVGMNPQELQNKRTQLVTLLRDDENMLVPLMPTLNCSGLIVESLDQFEIVKFTYTERLLKDFERLLKDIQDTLRVLDILLENDKIFNASNERDTNEAHGQAAPGAGLGPFAPGAGLGPFAPGAGLGPFAPGAGLSPFAPGAGLSPFAPGAGLGPFAPGAGQAGPGEAATAGGLGAVHGPGHGQGSGASGGQVAGVGSAGGQDDAKAAGHARNDDLGDGGGQQ